MNVNQIIWAMWFYIMVQYFFSRYVATQLNQKDPTYFDFPDGKFPAFGGFKPSMSIIEMMFDSDLPGPEYDQTLKRQIYAARIIYGLTIPLLILLLLW